jgi:glycosyltransferase involved in cell wall biosynthesis
VQPRLVSNGEASAAVTECLAAGLPTVVTDLGWCAELPDAAVGKVPVELTARALASAMAGALDDQSQRATLRRVARAHAEVNSFAAVAELYLELLC